MTQTDTELKKSALSSAFLQDKEEDKVIEIDYDSLVDLSQKDFSAQENLEEDKDSILFYCRDCKKPVEVSRLNSSSKKQKVRFRCDVCQSENVFYGTKRGLSQYFHFSA